MVWFGIRGLRPFVTSLHIPTTAGPGTPRVNIHNKSRSLLVADISRS
jgi:NhaP-type Na+/H+ or K+/H+ antiporter